MAFISLDNNNFYRPPLLPPPAGSRKPSKSPVPPEWTASFPSQIASTAYSSFPADAPILQSSVHKPSEPATGESLAINASIALVAPADSNSVPCYEPVVPTLAAGRQLGNEELCGRAAEEEGHPRDDIKCSSRQTPSSEGNSGNLKTKGVGTPTALPSLHGNMDLLDELPNDVFESIHPANEERRSTVPESPMPNILFDDEDQPTDSADQNLTIPVVQDVTHSQDSHDDAAASKVQSFETIRPLEYMDPDPTVHQTSQADQRFATTDTENLHHGPEQADSSHRPRRTRKTRESQPQRQHPRHSETAAISLQDARHGKRSRGHLVQVGMRLPSSPDRAESDDSDDHDYLDSSDEGDGGSHTQPQVRLAKRRKTAVACPVRERPGQDTREATWSNSADGLTLKQNANPMEQIRMCGRFFRKITLSQVQYFCYFTENPRSTALEPMAWNIEQEYSQDAGNKISNIQAMDVEGIFTRDGDVRGDTWSWCFKERNTPSPPSSQSRDAEHPNSTKTRRFRASKLHRPRKRIPYSAEEERLLIDLKRKQNLPWPEIATHFPGRKITTLQVHYSTKLKDRGEDASRANHEQGGESCTMNRSRQSAEDNTRCKRYGLRSKRRSPDRFAPE